MDFFSFWRPQAPCTSPSFRRATSTTGASQITLIAPKGKREGGQWDAGTTVLSPTAGDGGDDGTAWSDDVPGLDSSLWRTVLATRGSPESSRLGRGHLHVAPSWLDHAGKPRCHPLTACASETCNEGHKLSRWLGKWLGMWLRRCWHQLTTCPCFATPRDSWYSMATVSW